MNDKDNLRIAWLFPSLARGSYWHPVLCKFTQNFKETTVYTEFWPGFTPGYEGTFTVEVVEKTGFDIETSESLPRYSRDLVSVSPKIISHLLQLKPQVIFASSFSFWTLLALLFKPWGGWRIIIVYDGSSLNVDFRDSIVRSFFRRVMAQFADAAITNSHQGKAYLTDFLKAKESHVFARPYQVPDIKALSQQQEDTEGIDLGWRRPVFLFVGQVVPRKGLYHLLEACAILQRHEYRDYTVLIVGDGDQRDELEDYSQKHGLKDCVKWVKWVEYARLSAYFRSIDIFVFPTLEDIWGMGVLEAMVFGKPVLCSKWAGAAEMVIEGENGHIFDPHDPESLAKIMRRFIDEPELIVSMGQKSQQMIAQYTPETAAQFLVEVTSFVVEN